MNLYQPQPQPRALQLTSVSLPNMMPVVRLRPRLARALQAIIDAGDQGISSIELWVDGHIGGASVVSELRSLGARFAKEMRIDIHPFTGEKHLVAYFRYEGWELLQ